ncbi:MAG: ATP-binding cassette domain-containing protein, partial [Prochlorothrix sp.]
MRSATKTALEAAFTAPAVQVRQLSKSFKGQSALSAVDLSVGVWEMVALVGASGSGKSTLLRNLNALQQAEAGTVEIFGSP